MRLRSYHYRLRKKGLMGMLTLDEMISEGRYHQGGRTQCPAWGKTCWGCGLLNHFAKHCHSKQIENRWKYTHGQNNSSGSSQNKKQNNNYNDGPGHHKRSSSSLSSSRWRWLTRTQNRTLFIIYPIISVHDTSGLYMQIMEEQEYMYPRNHTYDWIGLDLFNDDTRPSGHISRPTQVNVSELLSFSKQLLKSNNIVQSGG